MGNLEKSQNYEIILFSCAKIRIFVNYCAKVSSIFFRRKVFLCHKWPETCNTYKDDWLEPG